MRIEDRMYTPQAGVEVKRTANLTAWIRRERLAVAVLVIQKQGEIKTLEPATMLDTDCYRVELEFNNMEDLDDCFNLLHDSRMLV